MALHVRAYSIKYSFLVQALADSPSLLSYALVISFISMNKLINQGRLVNIFQCGKFVTHGIMSIVLITFMNKDHH